MTHFIYQINLEIEIDVTLLHFVMCTLNALIFNVQVITFQKCANEASFLHLSWQKGFLTLKIR